MKTLVLAVLIFYFKMNLYVYLFIYYNTGQALNTVHGNLIYTHYKY